MLHYLYTCSLPTAALILLCMAVLWPFFSVRTKSYGWSIINFSLFVGSLTFILFATILTRTPGDYEVILTPFATFTAARQQPELYREMLMNVFLFFPLGLTLSNALPLKWHRWLRIILTTLVGCALSAGIEYAQYRYALGMAEVDDVICNTLGAFIGSTSLLIAHAIEKHKERAWHTNMTLTTTETQFLHIAKAAISGGDLPAEKVDWPAIFTLANQQKLLPILFEAVRKMPAAEENAALFAVTKQQVIGQVLNQTVRSAEFSDVYHKLRSAGLHPIVVKGQLCSRLYPLKDHRISADDDLLIPDGEFFACHEQLLANGLTTDTPVDELATADEVSYTKNGSPLYIELHRHLFDSAEDAHDELNHFFTDLKPIEVDGFLAMPPHEHLLYLLLHAYKHFVRSGIGLRQFCDIGLWVWEYHDEIDWQRLREQCKSVHAATFAAAAFRIVRDYLGIDFDLPAPWSDAVDAEPLLHDSLCGGVYGSNDLTRLHSSTVTLNAVKASRTGEKSSVLRTVFPKREYLERRYPYLKKRPYLLPVAWVQRIAHYASEKQSGAGNSASGSIKLAKERIELMKRYGIMD
ncbi:nucleotidyltransferase family protein [Faecousia sp.]|uniref:nucleotidyltransferase family protein n=1 Tax=Faecousia sp. TaxID=2952921 RepID=UPI002A923547|nr:nucleotidyltransferase family protein [Candidatus Faecousia sp.]